MRIQTMRVPHAIGKASIRLRLTSLFVTIFGVTLIVFSAVLYQVFTRIQENEFDTALYNHAVDVARSINLDLYGDLTLNPDTLTEGGKIFPFSLGKSYLQIHTVNGQMIARSRNLPNEGMALTPRELKSIVSKGVLFETHRILPKDSTHYRVISYFIDRPGPTDFILQIAVPMTLMERERQSLLTFFILAIPLILLGATLGGLFLSRRALAPVTAIVDKAQGIGVTRLSERVPVPETEDEIQELALTLNGLLNRLQQAFESQERFIADASHQLRTPLSILRGELDLIRSRPRTAEEVADFFRSASQEIDHLSRMVENLLILARIDAGVASLSIRAVRMDELILESVARFEGLAQSKSIRVSVNLGEVESASENAFEIQGDPDLLHTMFQSLLENAIKYAPEGSSVDVTARDEKSNVVIRVRDRGPGIAQSDMQRIFERFYRAREVQNQNAGLGLGLPIARRIAEVHQGALMAENHPDAGAIFTVQIKKV